ncbi:MAG: SGNH/GDSL hydrolase family protein [Candidatus Binatia bacterium]
MSLGRRLFAAAFLAGFGMLLALGTVELGVRLLHLVPDRFWEPDALLGSKLIAGSAGWWTQEEHEFLVPVQINTQGRRDLERPLEKVPGTERILLLGDSFVEAMQVPIEATFARGLEQHLTRPGDPPVEVMSMGVSGYGTASQYLYYREHGRSFHPDVVLLSFYPGNDVRNNSPTLEPVFPPAYGADGELERVTSGKAGDGGGRRGLLRSEAYAYFRKLLLTRQPVLAGQLASWGVLKKDALIAVPMQAGVPVDYWVYATQPPAEWQAAWAHTEQLLTRLRDAVRADGAKLIVMVVTSREQIYPADWQKLLATYPDMQAVAWDVNGPERRVMDWCARSGVPCVQLSRAFLAARDQSPRLHFLYDGHWTAAGHALAAQTMADFLRAAGWPRVQYAEG